MNRNHCFTLGTALFVSLVLPGQILAQPPVPGGPGASRPPVFSPYLNLTRQGSPTLNYYGLIRPEMQARQADRGSQADGNSQQHN